MNSALIEFTDGFKVITLVLLMLSRLPPEHIRRQQRLPWPICASCAALFKHAGAV